MKHIHVAAAVIRCGGKVLLASRPQGKPPYGLEFPGGKLEEGETVNQALKRELREELGIECVPADPIYSLETGGVDRIIHLTFVRTFVAPGTIFFGREGQSVEWYDLNGPRPADLLAPDTPVWNFLNNFQTE